MAKKIEINIPDNLSFAEEIKAIADAVNQKAIGTNYVKSIGSWNNVKIRDLKTEIVINRLPAEKPVETIRCIVCNCAFDKSIGIKAYTNYGGFIKVKIICSDSCIDDLISVCGDGRVSKKRKQIKPALLW